MAPPAAPVADADELVQLAARITRHLQQHPRDTQAQADLKYVTSQIPRQGGSPIEANPGAAVGAGLTQAALDIPKGILQTLMHPIQAAGQVTGLGNVGKFRDVLQDPESSISEKLDALVRATPLNVGYATERGLLNATGAKSDEPAPLEEQAHTAGNVASLALLGVNRNTPGIQLAGRVIGKIPLVGPLLRRSPAVPTVAPMKGLLSVGEDIGTPSPSATGGRPIPNQADIPRPMPPPVPLESPPSGFLESVIRAALVKQGFKGAALDRAMAVARQSPSVSAPTLTPMPGAPQGLLGPEGISPAPKASYPPTMSEMQGYNLGKPGHPAWQGEGSPTTSAEVRGGEPLLPSANPAVAQALQRAPFAKLQAALRLPETPTPIKDLILAELSRRGIVGPGLLAPR